MCPIWRKPTPKKDVRRALQPNMAQFLVVGPVTMPSPVDNALAKKEKKAAEARHKSRVVLSCALMSQVR